MSTIQGDKLKKLLDKTQEEAKELGRTVFIDDFLKLTRTIVDAFKDLKNGINSEMAKIRGDAEKQSKQLDDKISQAKISLETGVKKVLDEALMEQESGMNFVRDKVRDLKDGADADEEIMIERLRAMIPEPETFTIPKEILTTLQNNSKKIKELEDFIERFRKLPVGGRGGGGTSDIGNAASLGRIIRTETLSGTIDGVNTEFTVPTKITTILGYMLNGRAVPSGDYTISGRSITWGTAPIAAFSGKDHEIIYI